MIARVVVVAALVAGCGRDVRLGTATDAAVDVMADGNGNPFDAGSYTIAFLDPSMQSCDGTLAGMETSFASITRANLGLVDGSVTFTTPTMTALAISGTPISMALGQGSLDLAPSVGGPPGLWDGLVTGNFGAGPLSTPRTMEDLAADSTTAHAATIDAQIAVLYENAAGDGACTVGFQIAFTRS